MRCARCILEEKFMGMLTHVDHVDHRLKAEQRNEKLRKNRPRDSFYAEI